jgi:hypothetical protein
MFTVSQGLPGVWRIDLGPAAVVRIIALVVTVRKVGYAARRDQQR